MTLTNRVVLNPSADFVTRPKWPPIRSCLPKSHKLTHYPPTPLVAFRTHVVYTNTMKHRTNIYLRPDQVKRLKALHEKTGAPVAELVRRAVDEYLKKRSKEK